jgi:hypothetical protein
MEEYIPIPRELLFCRNSVFVRLSVGQSGCQKAEALTVRL